MASGETGAGQLNRGASKWVGLVAALAASALIAGVAGATPSAAPVNDAFSASDALTGAQGSVSGSTSDATREAGEPYHAGGPAGDSAARVPLLLAAGDIASCGSKGDEATASLIRARPRAVVATLGDNAYDAGRLDEFERCYAPTWGTAKARTRPAAGNHDYRTEDAAGYFAYFGRRAGHPSRGWYRYRLGRWHVIVLNSNCEHVGGCRRGSAQERWLRQTLAANHATCTLAYWHHPRFSSGDGHGSSPATADFWDALYEAGADVVLSGHDHVYERFAPQTPAGGAAPRRGVRAFVVGTGGTSLYGFRQAEPNSVVRVARYGVLALTLGRGRYSWRFLTADGSVSDAGSAPCVRAR